MSPGPLPGFRAGPAADIAALSQQIAMLTAQLAALRAEVQSQCVHQSPTGDLVFPANSQRVRAAVAGSTVAIDAGGCRVESAGVVNLSAGGQLTVTAAMMNANVALANFTGMVQANAIKANSVIGASYTPGAGNVW